MNSENSKTSEPHRFRLHLIDKLDMKDPKKNIALANLSIYYTWKNINLEYNNTKFKISPPTWNTLLQTFRIILNLSSKNTKLRLKMRQFKLTQIKSKT